MNICASYDRLTLAEQLGFDLASGKNRAQQQVSSAELVGTWRLVKFEDVEDGRIIRRFGETPTHEHTPHVASPHIN